MCGGVMQVRVGDGDGRDCGSSFPRRRESISFDRMDPRVRGDDDCFLTRRHVPLIFQRGDIQFVGAKLASTCRREQRLKRRPEVVFDELAALECKSRLRPGEWQSLPRGCVAE